MAHVTVREAAVRLGISEATVRRRLRNGALGQAKDETGRLWVDLSGDEAVHGPPAAAPPDRSTQQLIDELIADRDRWVAEAAAKQDMIDVLVHQAENFQVLLYEAQAQMKRLSGPPEKPPLLMERVDVQHPEDDFDHGPQPDAPEFPLPAAPDPLSEPQPAAKRSRWWRW